tara:strand:+ start:1346 stop:1594 length:249 start_codon:yes stop_codon:yes gene_type:complete
MEFIVFNTVAQAKNYVKRQQRLDYSQPECGGDCCSSERHTYLDDNNRVIVRRDAMSEYETDSICAVIGRVKKRTNLPLAKGK